MTVVPFNRTTHKGLILGKYLLCLIPLYICFILFIGVIMFRGRVAALRARSIKLNYFKSYIGDVAPELVTIQNNFSNHFEVPMIFFLTCIVAVQLNFADAFMLGLGILFVLSRFAHTYIHLGSNDVKKRAFFFFSGFAIVLVMWLRICLLMFN